jgi:hypothetical protein
MAKMRAKMQVGHVQAFKDNAGNTTQETVNFHAVSKSGAYPADGHDEDNDYARWSPSANLSISIANPALFGQFEVGQKFYVDFTDAP